MTTMSDIVERLRIPSDNEDTMKVWDNIRAIIADGNKGSWPRDIFESILSHIDEEREEAADEIERLRKALETAQAAMHDWLHLYAPDECKPEQVEESRKRVWPGGTIGYIADVTAEIRAALDAVKEG